MSDDASILKKAEVRATSIYSRWYADKDRLQEVLTGIQYDETARCTAILSALAWRLEFPLTLGHLRVVIGGDYWNKHCSLHYVKVVTGAQFLYWNHTEWFYVLVPSRSETTKSYGVSFVAEGRLMSGQPGLSGTMQMPLETPIKRFTLCHPFLESELHEPGRILLSRAQGGS